MKYCFGVDIGGTTVKLGIFEEEGKNIDKWEIPTYTENEGVRILPDIADSIKAKMEEHNINKEDVIGVGVGVPAPVTAEGIVNGTANLGWKYKEVKKPYYYYYNFLLTNITSQGRELSSLCFMIWHRIGGE